MPCRSGYESDDTYYYTAARNLAAYLCAVLSVAEPDIFDKIDYREGGFKRSALENWWKDHKAEDERRRQQERERIAKQELRKAALKKLTIEEAAALGIK